MPASSMKPWAVAVSPPAPPLMGEQTPEVGFGWKRLVTRKQARTIQS